VEVKGTGAGASETEVSGMEEVSEVEEESEVEEMSEAVIEDMQRCRDVG
jgi:hypothetical protein